VRNMAKQKGLSLDEVEAKLSTQSQYRRIADGETVDVKLTGKVTNHTNSFGNEYIDWELEDSDDQLSFSVANPVNRDILALVKEKKLELSVKREGATKSDTRYTVTAK
jgi:hypothetical protein